MAFLRDDASNSRGSLLQPLGMKGAVADRSDVDLVRAMSQGDRAALGLLFERHAARLLPIGLAVLGDVARAEDVLHDVFLEVWRHARSFDESRGSVATWLAVRMRSRSMDCRTVKLRRDALGAALSAGELLGSASGDAVRAAEYQQLARAISELPREESEVLMLGYFEDLSCSEMGQRLGVPVGTIKSRVRRALSALRVALAGTAEGDNE